MFLSDRWVKTNVLGDGVMRTLSPHTLGFLSFLQVFSSADAIAQESHKDFFKGKTIQLSVGFAAGGGYDSYARMIAPFIAREIGSTVIVVNQPGAGGIASLNDMARATPDGLKMSLVNGWSNGLSQVLGVDGVRYDLAKFGMLGTISASPSVWIVGTRAKLTTIDHVRASPTPVNWAVTSVDDGLYVGAAITCFSLKLNCKFVPGYRGTNDGFLSVARGETDMIYLGDTSASNYVKAGDVIALATMSRKRSSLFPNLPTIFDYRIRWNAVWRPARKTTSLPVKTTSCSMGSRNSFPPHSGTGAVTLISAVKQLSGTRRTSPRPGLFTCSHGSPMSGPGSWRK